MLVALALAFALQAETALRTDVPIREVMLSDGTRRYAVPLSIAGHRVEAGLDTGSVGLRALPDAAQGARKSGPEVTYGYGVGTELVGPTAEATVSVGALANTVALQAVDAIGCSVNRPACPASRLSPAQFGIQGNGLPGQGFRAILGTGLTSAGIANPLVALGAHRWIVELPLPGQDRPGRLILNPSADEQAGFTPLVFADQRRDRRNDAVQSCLRNSASGWELCAPTLIDTGAPGIEVVNREGSAWPDGTHGSFKFSASAATSMTMQFDSGRRAQASRLAFVRDSRLQRPLIRSGLIAYFAFAVLYDADRDLIEVRPRPPYPGGPTVVQ